VAAVSRHVISIVRCFLVFQNAHHMKATFQILMFFILLTIASSLVYACECKERSQRRKFRDADVVFVGEVILFGERAGLNTNKDFEFFPYIVTFKVEKQWKGKRQSELAGFADLKGDGMCEGFEMPVGERFLIYAQRKSGFLLVHRSFCSPNKNVKDAQDEIKNLNNFFFRAYAFLYPYPKF
jgi:hypothetical protein